MDEESPDEDSHCGFCKYRDMYDLDFYILGTGEVRHFIILFYKFFQYFYFQLCQTVALSVFVSFPVS